MTTTFLSKPQQVAMQHALISSKLIGSSTVKSENPLSQAQQAYSDIAVMLYRFNLQKIKWPSFLKAAINTASNECSWLTRELARCQQSYKAQPNDAAIIEQSAFFCGIFSEELAYIDTLLGTDPQPE
jgi:virulence-associated protein VapD